MFQIEFSLKCFLNKIANELHNECIYNVFFKQNGYCTDPTRPQQSARATNPTNCALMWDNVVYLHNGLHPMQELKHTFVGIR